MISKTIGFRGTNLFSDTPKWKKNHGKHWVLVGWNLLAVQGKVRYRGLIRFWDREKPLEPAKTLAAKTRSALRKTLQPFWMMCSASRQLPTPLVLEERRWCWNFPGRYFGDYWWFTFRRTTVLHCFTMFYFLGNSPQHVDFWELFKGGFVFRALSRNSPWNLAVLQRYLGCPVTEMPPVRAVLAMSSGTSREPPWPCKRSKVLDHKMVIRCHW